MDFEKLTDKNVGQLEFAAQHLTKNAERQGARLATNRSLPGSRPDGGMEMQPRDTRELLQQIERNDTALRANLVDARNLIDNLERDIAQLQSELAETKARYDNERARCEELKGILHKAAEIMVNGRQQ